MKDLKCQDLMVRTLAKGYSKEEIYSIGRELGIDKVEYNIEPCNMVELSEKFVTKVWQLDKQQNLLSLVGSRQNYKELLQIPINNRTAEKFGKLFNTILEKLNYIEEKPFDESELFDPMEFEDKMRNKAKLNEDIVKAGIRIKPDICVLRRKAYNMDFKKYNKMIQKLARFYRNEICATYPIDKYNSDKRFNALYESLIDMIPEEVFNEDDDIDEKVEGIIYDTISKCLIFNE